MGGLVAIGKSTIVFAGGTIALIGALTGACVGYFLLGGAIVKLERAATRLVELERALHVAVSNRECMVPIERAAPPPPSPGSACVSPAAPGRHFWIDRHEVALGDFRRFRTPPAQPWAEDETLPLVNVSFDDAAAYCAWRAARLPTDAEWTLAAAGREERRHPWGAKPPDRARVHLAWPEAIRKPIATRCEQPEDVTPEGVWHLAGNVREWVVGKSRGQVHLARGGCFDTPTDRPAGLEESTSAYGRGEEPGDCIGFRCALDAGEDAP